MTTVQTEKPRLRPTRICLLETRGLQQLWTNVHVLSLGEGWQGYLLGDLPRVAATPDFWSGFLAYGM